MFYYLTSERYCTNEYEQKNRQYKKMKTDIIKKYAGKRVYMVLKNNFEYTTTLPDIITENFTIIDKFGESIDIDCSIVSFIKVCKDDK